MHDKIYFHHLIENLRVYISILYHHCFKKWQDVMWTCLISKCASIEIQLWYISHRVCWYLSYKKSVLTATFLSSLRSLKKLEGLCSGPCCQESVWWHLFWSYFCSVFFWFSSVPLCQCPQSVKDHQDVKKQLSLLFSLLPSLCVWIPF